MARVQGGPEMCTSIGMNSTELRDRKKKISSERDEANSVDPEQRKFCRSGTDQNDKTVLVHVISFFLFRR